MKTVFLYYVRNMADDHIAAITEFEWSANNIAKQSAMRYGQSHEVMYMPKGDCKAAFSIRRFSKEGFEIDLDGVRKLHILTLE